MKVGQKFTVKKTEGEKGLRKMGYSSQSRIDWILNNVMTIKRIGSTGDTVDYYNEDGQYICWIYVKLIDLIPLNTGHPLTKMFKFDKNEK